MITAAGRVADGTRVLKHGDTFAVFDRCGDITRGGLGEQGLYHHGTRHLSRFGLDLDGRPPFFLSSTVRDENDQLAVALTNFDVVQNGEVRVPHRTLHLALKTFLWDGTCYQQLRIKNHGLESVAGSVDLHFAADYADVFELSGKRRTARGEDLSPEVTADRVVLAYRGLDDLLRRTILAFAPAPTMLTASTATFRFSLPPQDELLLQATVACERGASAARLLLFEDARSESEHEVGRYRALVLPSPHLERADQRLGRPRGARPAHDDHGAADRTVPLRRGALAEHALRPRRDHHRAGMLLAASCPCPRRARVPRIHPGDPADPRRGRRARQDPAREPRWGDGDPTGSTVRSLLRQRGCHATVRPPRGGLLRAHRRPGLHRDAMAEHRGRARLDRPPRGSRRRRLRRVPAAVFRRAASSGMEGQRPCRVPRRRLTGRGPDRPVRGPGVCLRGPASGRDHRAPAGQGRASGGTHTTGRGAAQPVRGDVLVRGPVHLRAGPRRPEAAMPGAHVQRGPVPLHGYRPPGARHPPGPHTLGPRLVLRVGGPHSRRRRGPLQSDELSQRLGLAP